jgi:ribosomal protein S18 acetylase RimI-like enzyme
MGLYKKVGFKEVARIPKQIQYKGKLLGEVIMVLYL